MMSTDIYLRNYNLAVDRRISHFFVRSLWEYFRT